MTIMQKLINALLQRIKAVPVPQQELDDFLAQNQIQLSPEHYRFLLDYGNSPFLTHEMACLSFDYFKGYYYELEYEFLEGLILPPNSGYLGTDFLSEAICLNYEDHKVYCYDAGETFGAYYGGLSELLFYYLFRETYRNECFDIVKYRIPISDIEQFKQEYLDYEIKDVFIYNHFFFKDGRLITCGNRFDGYDIYAGGVLDQLA